jgi:hypothetical protein
MHSEDNVTAHEQHIYNTHLKVQRTRRNQPFKYRKDFSNIEPQTQRYLQKISQFLKKHSHINLNEFIVAPFKIYPDEEFFNLEYYTTLKATKAYTSYQQKLLTMSPDSQEQLENTQKALKYILQFCIDNDIPVTEYINHKTNNIYSFLLHLKEHRVNVYCLFGFNSFDKNIKSVDSDLTSFIIGNDLIVNLPIFRTKYLNSNKARKFVELGIQKITQKNNCIN